MRSDELLHNFTNLCLLRGGTQGMEESLEYLKVRVTDDMNEQLVRRI
jgi:hypothetical protein